MKINLNDNGLHLRFAPLSLTRPIGNLRMGIFTNDERWLAFLNGFELNSTVEIGYSTEQYLQGKFPKVENGIEINAAVIPNDEVVASVLQLEEDSMLLFEETWIAKNGTGSKKIAFTGTEPVILEQRWDLYQKNDVVLITNNLYNYSSVYGFLINKKDKQKINITKQM